MHPTGKSNPHASQRSLDFFDMQAVENDVIRDVSRVRKPIDTRKASDRVNAMKKTQEELRELKQNVQQSDRDIEELENTPAFKRKQIQLDPQKFSEETKVSKYSLTDDENSQVKLSKENPYLHGAVD